MEQKPKNGTHGMQSALGAVVAESAILRNNSEETEQTNKFNSFEDLDETNRDRYYNLIGYYEQRYCLDILSNLTQYSTNTWKLVNSKIQFILDGEHADEYHTEIAKVTDVDEYYSNEEIIRFISSLRRTLKLPPYKTNVAKLCGKDFTQTYMALPTMSTYNDPKTKKPFIAGYTLIFNLDCQIN
ncbi:MAG: hypothetical protein EOO43_07310 [Flavobacterium sp.]|nr:MAG: hypothetical protein EOO43_07310 [Flavobacterium sp.]